jgi:hypothetical protein
LNREALRAGIAAARKAIREMAKIDIPPENPKEDLFDSY